MLIFSYGLKKRTLEQAKEMAGVEGNVQVFSAVGLPNPFSVPDLKHQNGLDEPVRKWMWQHPKFRKTLKKVYQAIKNNDYDHVAVHCMGGRHRSVIMVEELAALLEADGYAVGKKHLELGE